jgi:hypothetical protein
MEKVRVSNFPDLRKDMVNGGVINSNKESYSFYKEQRSKMLKELSEKDLMKEEINNMKDDIAEMKTMLKLLLDKR